MDLDWTLATAGPVTLVRVRLRNVRATDRRVRLRNRLDGPVLPPRRRGTPEAGWDRDGVETVVPAGETAALGYACPAPETEPPVVVDDVGPAQAGDPDESTVDVAARELGDHRPPRDVLGGEADGSNWTAASESAAISDQPRDAEDSPDSAHKPSTPRSSAPEPSASAPPDGGTHRDTTDELPDGADALLTRYRTRIETAEALSAADVRAATALLEATGGLAGVEELTDELDQNARELRALAATAATLAHRAQAATPPTEALRRLS